VNAVSSLRVVDGVNTNNYVLLGAIKLCATVKEAIGAKLLDYVYVHDKTLALLRKLLWANTNGYALGGCLGKNVAGDRKNCVTELNATIHDWKLN
jgi:hypothetical protein